MEVVGRDCRCWDDQATDRSVSAVRGTSSGGDLCLYLYRLVAGMKDLGSESKVSPALSGTAEPFSVVVVNHSAAHPVAEVEVGAV